MSIQSPYAIILTPASGPAITLVAAGGWLSEVPVFEASQGVFESDGVNLGKAFFRPLAGVAVTITFETEEDHESLADALDAFLASGETELTLSGVLSIGGMWFHDAVVTITTPELPSGPAATVTRSYTVRTSIPEPEPT